MKIIYTKIIAILAILVATGFIGIHFVAPRVLLKLTREVSTSTAADYGMRFDEFEILTDDSLVLKGDFIYPFHNNVSDTPPTHSVIVLHPIKKNTRSLYTFLRYFTTLNSNFITYDSRAHGRSDGHMFTLGVKEANDVSLVIDRILELHPDHSFGIYARGNTSNIALKALIQDKRIRYGVLENYFDNATETLHYLNSDDVFVESEMFNTYLLKQALKFLKVKPEEIELDLTKVDQPILILSTKYNDDKLQKLFDKISSEDKYKRRFDKNVWLLPNAKDDEGLKECLWDFLETYAIQAQEYSKENMFQLSNE